MKDQNAQTLLAKVMNWEAEETVLQFVPDLQILSIYKYDQYQQFAPGKRFIESLALWLNQFDQSDRDTALRLITERLIFFSEKELSHIVGTAYPDMIEQSRILMVAEEQGILPHLVGRITRHSRYKELRLKSLYLGLSDGARTNELRRASYGDISNEQIWQAYELGEEKAEDMVKELGDSLTSAALPTSNPRFNIIWLLDDFSGSGNTYIRFDNQSGRYKGKIKKIYERLSKGDLVDTSHYEVYLLLYVATRKAVDHIQYWADRFTSEKGYKPLQVRVLYVLEDDVAVPHDWSPELRALIESPSYYDHKAWDKHMLVGGGTDARLGFAQCGLPVVLAHNTPNNSVYVLWGPESFSFYGLFPRISRHREF